MHVPQSIAAETELTQLASVNRLIISPRLNAPIIQMVQDTLTGAYRISIPGVKIHEQAAMNMLSRIRRPLSTFKMTGNSVKNDKRKPSHINQPNSNNKKKLSTK